jgi:hypothetical protein
MVEWKRRGWGASALGVNVACNMAKSTLRRINSKHHAGAHGLSPPQPPFWLQLLVASSVKWPLNSGSTQRRQLLVGLSCCSHSCCSSLHSPRISIAPEFSFRRNTGRAVLEVFCSHTGTYDSRLHNLYIDSLFLRTVTSCKKQRLWRSPLHLFIARQTVGQQQQFALSAARDWSRITSQCTCTFASRISGSACSVRQTTATSFQSHMSWSCVLPTQAPS